ncbi:MAG: hypothetical protein ACOYKN_17090, partial [Pirellula sp.]
MDHPTQALTKTIYWQAPLQTAWLFHQRSISVPSAVRVAARFLESHAKTQRRKGKRTKIFNKIYYQERASSVVSVPLWF